MNKIKAYHSLNEMLETSFMSYGSHKALICNDEALSYEKLNELSRDLAAWLQNDIFFEQGDRIAIMLPNSLQYAISVIGILRAGMVVVNINPNATSYEIQKYISDSSPKGIVTLSEMKWKLPENDDLYIIDVDISTLLTMTGGMKAGSPAENKKITFKQALTIGGNFNFIVPETNAGTLAFLQYTGGTSGTLKAAMLTHGNISANLNQLNHVCGNYLHPGKERIITALPLYHIFSLTVNFLYFISIGALNILIRDAREIDNIINAMMLHSFTSITGVNTLYSAMMNHPKFKELNFSAVNFCVSGGTELFRSVAEQWLEITGKPILVGYGMTECSPLVSVQSFTTADCQFHVGRPVKDTQIKIVDAAGNDVPYGEKGEVIVKGPQVMTGYWQRPEETQESLRDGWYFTGDLAVQDQDGTVTLQGRKKDLIIVSGLNVYPAEIEAVVLKHPSVKEVVAIGVSDEMSGEAIKLFIVSSELEPEENEIRMHCREFLTSYKIPKHIEFVESLPKSGVGKVLRFKLKSQTL